MTDLRNKVACAYGVALHTQKAAVGLCTTPRIHIGTGVRDYLVSLCTGTDSTPPPYRATLWGFPVVIEDDWPEDRIVVRTDQEIM